MFMSRFLGPVLSSAVVLTAPGAYAHSLPLGDGKISSSPRTGYVFSCQTRFPKNAPGAFRAGEWIDEAAGTWDPDGKPIVDGNVKWPGKVSVSLEGDSRVIRANGLPVENSTGIYPVRRSDDAYDYDRNPNSIRRQNILLTFDATPALAASPSCVSMGMIGFTLAGVAIFNALDARGQDAPAHEIQDKCNGHPERTGEYHYHNYSSCFSDTRSGPNGTSDLIGYALDGFGIYGMYENGRKLTTADLDECHGRTSPVMWDGKAVTIYHYVFTEDYPYTIGCFKGSVSGPAHAYMRR